MKASIVFVVAFVAIIAGVTGSVRPMHHAAAVESYFLVNGPEYREVSRTVFDSYRPSCTDSEDKVYEAGHVVEHRCYL
ncbi:MAG: hypothetical protein NVSMB64_04480 [Candidatus Velthaea sp.]